MSNASDFIIENGVLKKYVGPGGDVIVPSGVTKIDGYWSRIFNGAFKECSTVTSVVIPEGVTEISHGAFSRCKELRSVVLPKSLTKIGRFAFSDCINLKEIFIPEGITEIDEYTFYSCENLDRIVFPEKLRSIGTQAFYNCKSLKRLQFPDSLADIQESAFENCESLQQVIVSEGFHNFEQGSFYGCKALADNSGFVLINSELFSYCGTARDVEIPKTVTRINGRAFKNTSVRKIIIPASVDILASETFYGCRQLEEVIIPEGLKSIGDQAFSGCSELIKLKLPTSLKTIGTEAFSDCDKLELTLPVAMDKGVFSSKLFLRQSREKSNTKNIQLVGTILFHFQEEEKKVVYYGKGFSQNGNLLFKSHNLQEYGTSAFNWQKYDLNVINNGPDFKFSTKMRLYAALYRLMDPEGLLDGYRLQYEELIRKNAKKVFEIAEHENEPEMLSVLFKSSDFTEKEFAIFSKKMKKSSSEKIKSFEIPDITNSKRITSSKAAGDKYLQLFKEANGEELLKKAKLKGVIWPVLELKDGSSSQELLKYLIVEYGKLYEKYPPHTLPEVDQCAEEVDKVALQSAFDIILETVDFLACPMLLFAYCRYASGVRISNLISKMKDWDNYKISGQRGKKAVKALRLAIYLSDTREALIYFVRNVRATNRYPTPMLDYYASFRDVDAEYIRDFKIVDFELDQVGKKQYRVQDQSYTLTVKPDLQIELFDNIKGKIVSDISKRLKNAPEYDEVIQDYTDIRNNVRPAFKACCDILLDTYLQKRLIPANKWEDIYQMNPISRYAAERLVWQQDSILFTMVNGKTVDSKGKSIELNDSPVYLMHPMDTDKSFVSAWQEFFLKRRIKQPFAQLWEPAISESEVKSDRYKECKIPRYCLQNRERHGIMWDEQRIPATLNIAFCNIEYMSFAQSAYKQYASDDIEIKEFRPQQWNRYVNHIVAYLDKTTLTERAKKDDVSIADRLYECTFAQITEFIRAAQEANANNVLALLMDYKNIHFADYDPMDEFTLE